MKRIIIIRELGTQRHMEEPRVYDEKEKTLDEVNKEARTLQKIYPPDKYEIIQGGADSLEDFYSGYGRYRPRNPL